MIKKIQHGWHSCLFILIAIIAFNFKVFADQPIHHVSAETCKTCHEQIYNQWSGSMHAQSAAVKDPIHGAFYRNVVGDPTAEGVTTKNGKYPVCLQCHAPNAARDKTTKLDAKPAYSEGVNCVACHTLKSLGPLKTDDGNLPFSKLLVMLEAHLLGGCSPIFIPQDDFRDSTSNSWSYVRHYSDGLGKIIIRFRAIA